jgi:hypothetical protein
MHSPNEGKFSPDTRHVFGSQNDHAQMFQMIGGFRISQIVRSAALFSLAEHLANGPATATEIAEAESIDATAAFRLMRACASLGLVTYDGQSRFAATPLLNTLHRDDPHSLRGPALAQPAPVHWLPWGRLHEAIRTGQPQALAALGRNPWDYLADSPAEAEAFTLSMHRISSGVAAEAAACIDTRSVDVAIDVGGASGILVLSLMTKNPTLQGVVFDLPHVVPSAAKAAEALGLQDRFSVQSGDFFSSVPPADLYLIKWIMHDWDDAACISILRNCARAMRPGGRIILIEMVIDEVGAPGYAPQADLTMLAVHGGKERTLDEFKQLLAAADLRVSRVTPTSTPFVLIEANAM